MKYLAVLFVVGSLASGSLAWAGDGQAGGTSWPMFRGNQTLSGVTTARFPADPKLRWTHEIGEPIKSSAAIEGGRVYIGGDDGNLRALTLESGKEIWRFQTEGMIEASPLVLGETVYIGSGDGCLYALNQADGRLKWKYQTDDQILGSSNWVKAPDGKSTWILVGSYDFFLHCVEAQTGQAVWKYESGNYINGAPAVSRGRTVFGGCDALLHVISLADGSKVKEVPTGAYIAGSVAMVDDQVYVGHYECEFLCIDVEEEALKWKYRKRNFPYYSSPAVTDKWVVFGGRDRRLHCLDRRTGEERWEFAVRGKIDSSAVVSDGKVLVGSDDGRLYVVSLDEGKELWSYEIGGPITASPAVVDGWIVVGSEDGSVYAFGEGIESDDRQGDRVD